MQLNKQTKKVIALTLALKLHFNNYKNKEDGFC